jgi:hypothetical protein
METSDMVGEGTEKRDLRDLRCGSSSIEAFEGRQKEAKKKQNVKKDNKKE